MSANGSPNTPETPRPCRSISGSGWSPARGWWDRAASAYAEACRARPRNSAVWYALARFHVERGHLDRAAATLAEAVRRMPEDPDLLRRLGLVLLCSGDRAGWRGATAAGLDRFAGTSSVWSAYRLALTCLLGPEGTADPKVPVRLAEVAVRGAGSETTKSTYSSTLGAVLYRAGRFNEAIGRLEEGIRLRGGVSLPQEWAFLAMTHHRLGHRDEALRWLDRLREHQPAADPTQFWNELESGLLRSEAEAVVLYDSVFPADPFAH